MQIFLHTEKHTCTHLCILRSVYLYTCISVYLSACLLVCLSVCLSSVCLSVCLSVCACLFVSYILYCPISLLITLSICFFFLSQHTQLIANKYGLKGYVKNTERGTVVGTLQGPSDAVDSMCVCVCVCV